MPEKYDALSAYAENLDNCAVAFSGGCDSSFLLKVFHEVLGDGCTALTFFSPLTPLRDIDESIKFCKEYGISQIIIEKNSISAEVKKNSSERCYLCKKDIFSQLISEAEKRGIKNIAEGSNADDVFDYRPGMKALKEMGILSPLLECSMSKKEVREFSKKLGLPTADKKSSACLASRIPYGEEIDADKLKRIDMSENYISSLGFSDFRVRSHENLARIEFLKKDIHSAVESNMLEKISSQLKLFGFVYVSVDADGFKSGSMNREIKEK
ncbi:MAG: ATP-dependent sacrificial sulfur transferase LarE [Spirochaetes bacterium]|nr:ATP-dependent sacrificial sulfur transferase LarE [Spirochaetota bacterium]